MNIPLWRLCLAGGFAGTLAVLFVSFRRQFGALLRIWAAARPRGRKAACNWGRPTRAGFGAERRRPRGEAAQVQLPQPIWRVLADVSGRFRDGGLRQPGGTRPVSCFWPAFFAGRRVFFRRVATAGRLAARANSHGSGENDIPTHASAKRRFELATAALRLGRCFVPHCSRWSCLRPSGPLPGP